MIDGNFFGLSQVKRKYSNRLFLKLDRTHFLFLTFGILKQHQHSSKSYQIKKDYYRTVFRYYKEYIIILLYLHYFHLNVLKTSGFYYVIF